MTIDPKAADLAKALADAVAAQQTPEYQELAAAAKRKAEIDSAAEKAAYRLKDHYVPSLRPVPGVLGDASKVDQDAVRRINGSVSAPFAERDTDIFDPPEPERYELPTDETATAKPSNGLAD